MRIKHSLYVIAMGLIFSLHSCTTYYIPVDSFKQQLSGGDTVRLKQVTTRGPFGDVVTYNTYPIDFIKCVDKNGNQVVLKNGPSLEVRFTDSNNKKTVFYFDRVFISGNTVTGVRSRIISSITKTIPLNTIKLIEIQDGRKKYRYVN